MRILKGLALLFSSSEASSESPDDTMRNMIIMGQGSFRPPSAMLIAMVNQNSHSDNKMAAVEALLKGSEKFQGININSKDYMGRSVLMNAVNNVDIEMVHHLFKVDDENDNVGPLRIDDTDHWGGTALHLIVRAPFKPYGFDETVEDWPLKRRFEKANTVLRILLNKGANVNQLNSYGQTPLMLAASNGFSPGVEMLAGEYGADVNVQSPEIFANGLQNRKAGYTALDMAVEQRAYLAAIERPLYYYDMVITFLCNNGGQQFKTEAVC